MPAETITILYLYPDEMSFYGDSGNVLAICRRLEWRGYKANVIYHRIGDDLPKRVDIVLGGGGQDIGQLKIHADLLLISEGLRRLADNDVPMLMVCGLYQLFGSSFTMANRQTLQGIGIFDIDTTAGPKRLIGNIVSTTIFGDIVGFENHSGQTILGRGQLAFGKVKAGFGNNESRENDGAIYRQVYGTYMHGALLPKNPVFADALIQRALTNKYHLKLSLPSLDDSLADMVHRDANNRR